MEGGLKQSVMRRLWLLGPTRVDIIQPARSEAQENAVSVCPRFRSRRTVGLLGYLATERRPVARGFLAALFWPDETPSKGLANLSRELHNLAQILPYCWQSDRNAVAFICSADTIVDLYQLQQMEVNERWEEATDLLGGEFLEGLYLDDNPEFEDWLLGQRDSWRVRAETVLRRVIEGQIRRGRYTEALYHAQRLLHIAPWDEETNRQIMRLLAWIGQRGAALRQFESFKQVLREQLAVEPDSEAIALYQRIQAGKLNLPPQLPAFLLGETARHAFVQPLFVGREPELARLDSYIEKALVGQGCVTFITGGPGRGKTALLGALAQRALEMHPNLLVASGKCNAYSGMGDPYLPFRDVMAMLTGDLEGRWDVGAISSDHALRLWDAFSLVVQVLLDHGPHLLDVFVPAVALLSRSTAAGEEYAPWLPRLKEQVKRDSSRREELEQSHLFQQLSRVLRRIAHEKPLLLILDDMQWADAASASLLFDLCRRLADNESRLLVACAYRPEEIALDRAGQRHPLAKVLSEFKRTFGNVWVNLSRTEEREDRRFVDALLDVEPNRLEQSFRTALFDRTGGHPLFTIELLGSMKDRGDLITDADGSWIEATSLDWQLLPARVEAVIEERIDRLDNELLVVLTIASVEGEEFTAQVVAEVLKAPVRSILGQLSQVLERQHRLVKEQEEAYSGQRRLSRYRFSHILFQNYLYKRLGQGEQRLLHGSVAAAIEKFYDGQLEEMAVQLARHFDQAGDNDKAYQYYCQAGDRAANLYESGEAITHYTRAIQLADRVTPDAVSLAHLHHGRGLAYERLGDFEQANANLIATLQLAHAADANKMEGYTLLDLGRLWASRDHNQAHDYFEAALEIAHGMDEPAFKGSSLNWMGNWCLNNDNFKSAIAYHREALNIFEDLGNQGELANTLDLLGIANLMCGDLDASYHYYDRAIDLFRELDDRLRLASCLMGRASTAAMLLIPGSTSLSLPHDPNPDIDEAHRTASEIGSTSNVIWVHYTLGMLYTIHGYYGQALKDFQNGLRIASEINHREWVVANLFARGMLYTELFSLDQAQRQLERGLVLAQEHRSPMWIHLTSGALAGVYLMLDDRESALTCLERAIASEMSMDTLGKRYCWIRRAELALVGNDPVLALDITDRLIASSPGISQGRVITFLWKLKADALASLGHEEDALTLLQAAIENVQATGERFLLWRLHASLGQIYTAMGNMDAADFEYSAARRFIDELASTIPNEILRGEYKNGACRILQTPL